MKDSSSNQLFISVGELRIKIIEASLSKTWVSPNPGFLFGYLSLLEPESYLAYVHVFSIPVSSEEVTTSKKSTYLQLLVGEDISIEKVSSLSSVKLSLFFREGPLIDKNSALTDVSLVGQAEEDVANTRHALQDILNDTRNTSLGFIDIPIVRFDNGKKITQWYQMLDWESLEGSKNSIRLEIQYVADATEIRSPPKQTWIKPFDAFEGDSSTIISSEPIAESNLNENIEPDLDIVANDSTVLGDTAPVLPVGIIDYAVIIGHPITNISDSDDENAKESECDCDIENISSENQSMALLSIWDRFPRYDYPDNPLPDKIEWFACPEGFNIVKSLKCSRPSCKISNFVLSTGAEQGEVFGLRLRSYYLIGINDIDDIVLNRESTEIAPQWWLESDSGDSSTDLKEARNKVWKWASFDIVLVSQFQFIEKLSRCILELYHNKIIPCLERYESMFSQTTQTTHRNLYTSPYDSLSLDIEEIFVFLSMHCPLPLPGLFEVNLNYRSLQSSTDHAVNLFRVSQMDLPSCSYNMLSIVRQFGARLIVDLFCALLNESKILIHSSDPSIIPPLCEFLRNILYPIPWIFVYIPIVPSHLLDLLEAPVPFLLGIDSASLRHLHMDIIKDVVIVDCDLKSFHPSSQSLLSFELPSDLDRWIIMTLDRICAWGPRLSLLLNDLSEHATLHCPGKLQFSNPITSENLFIQLVFFDVLLYFLKDISNYSFSVSSFSGIFHRPQFLKEKREVLERRKLVSASNYLRCFEKITECNGFHRLVNLRESSMLTFFVNSLDSFPRPCYPSGDDSSRPSSLNYLYSFFSDRLPIYLLDELDEKKLDNMMLIVNAHSSNMNGIRDDHNMYLEAVLLYRISLYFSRVGWAYEYPSFDIDIAPMIIRDIVVPQSPLVKESDLMAPLNILETPIKRRSNEIDGEDRDETIIRNAFSKRASCHWKPSFRGSPTSTSRNHPDFMTPQKSSGECASTSCLFQIFPSEVDYPQDIDNSSSSADNAIVVDPVENESYAEGGYSANLACDLCPLEDKLDISECSPVSRNHIPQCSPKNTIVALEKYSRRLSMSLSQEPVLKNDVFKVNVPTRIASSNSFNGISLQSEVLDDYPAFQDIISSHDTEIDNDIHNADVVSSVLLEADVYRHWHSKTKFVFDNHKIAQCFRSSKKLDLSLISTSKILDREQFQRDVRDYLLLENSSTVFHDEKDDFHGQDSLVISKNMENDCQSVDIDPIDIDMTMDLTLDCGNNNFNASNSELTQAALPLSIHTRLVPKSSSTLVQCRSPDSCQSPVEESQLDEYLLRYLQVILEGRKWNQDTEGENLRKQSFNALKDAKNRRLLVKILEQKRQWKRDNLTRKLESQQSEEIWGNCKVCQDGDNYAGCSSSIDNNTNSNSGSSCREDSIILHEEGFLGLLEIFIEMLNNLSQEQDYVAAYDLLELSSYYYHVLDHNNLAIDWSTNGEGEGEGDVVAPSYSVEHAEFLRCRIMNHHIFQHPMLWKTIFAQNISRESLKTLLHPILIEKKTHDILSYRDRSMLKEESILTALDSLEYVAQSILLTMIDINLNITRATTFLQEICLEYSLPLFVFDELLLFAQELWRLSELNDSQSIKDYLHENKERESIDSPLSPEQSQRICRFLLCHRQKFHGVDRPSRGVVHSVSSLTVSSSKNNDTREVVPSFLSSTASKKAPEISSCEKEDKKKKRWSFFRGQN